VFLQILESLARAGSPCYDRANINFPDAISEIEPKPVLFHFFPADNLTAALKDQTH
jgi:hypothetical protein